MKSHRCRRIYFKSSLAQEQPEQWLGSNGLINLFLYGNRKKTTSDKHYTFGSGKRHLSEGNVLIALFVHNRTKNNDPFIVNTEIEDAKVPLLISLGSLRAVDATLDFKQDRLTTPDFETGPIYNNIGHV